MIKGKRNSEVRLFKRTIEIEPYLNKPGHVLGGFPIMVMSFINFWCFMPPPAVHDGKTAHGGKFRPVRENNRGQTYLKDNRGQTPIKSQAT